MENWKFLDYISEAGTNHFKDWLDDLPLKERMAINTRIQYLEAVNILKRPDTGMLTGNCDGLFEIRIKCNNVQYRPLACYGPDKKTIILLAGAIEKGGKLIPKDICKEALKRKKYIEKEGRTYEHSYEEI